MIGAKCNRQVSRKTLLRTAGIAALAGLVVPAVSEPAQAKKKRCCEAAVGMVFKSKQTAPARGAHLHSTQCPGDPDIVTAVYIVAVKPTDCAPTHYRGKDGDPDDGRALADMGFEALYSLPYAGVKGPEDEYGNDPGAGKGKYSPLQTWTNLYIFVNRQDPTTK